MATMQCPHCRTVQLSPPQSGAACVNCRRPLIIGSDPHAPLPPQIANPPPTPPPIVRAPLESKPPKAIPPPPTPPPPPKATSDEPPKEPVKVPPGRGLWLEVSLLMLLAIALGTGVFLTVWLTPPVDRSVEIAQAKDADVFVVPAEPPAPNEPIHWTDASRRAVRKRGFKVRIDRVMIQKVMARDANRQPIAADDREHLQVHLHVSNDSAAPKIYIPWFGNEFMVDGKRRGATLVDDLGREYPEARFANVTEIQGVATETTLAPKEELRDTLIFDLPDDTHVRDVAYWRLTLPAAAAEDTGLIRVEIPRKMME